MARRFLTIPLFFVCCAYPAVAQPAATRPAFEVASVKVSQLRGRAKVETSPVSLAADGSLAYLVAWAFDLKRYQVSGDGVSGSERYQIAAKASQPLSVGEMRRMLQALLEERFKLAHHRIKRDLVVYALVVAKGGPKLKKSDEPGESITRMDPKKPGSGGTSLRTSMAQFADLLDGDLPDPVVDLTGLKDRYDFTLDIGSYLGGMQPGDLPGVVSEALKKQLGLNLERRKISVEILVVDHAERPPVE